MFRVSTNGLASLSDYRTAKEYYHMRKKQMDENKRIRNRYDGAPLQTDTHSAWSYKYVTHNKDDDSYSLYLYNTPVLTFYKDGWIKIDNSVPSQSTSAFVGSMIGRRLQISLSSTADALGIYRARVRRHGHKDVINADGYDHRFINVYFNKTVSLKVEGDVLVVKDYKLPVVQRVGSRGTVIKTCKPVVDYVTTLHALSGASEISKHDNWATAHDQAATVFEQLQQGEFDPDDALALAAKAVKPSWDYGTGNQLMFYIKEFKALLYAAGYKAQGLLVDRVIPFGKAAPKDAVY